MSDIYLLAATLQPADHKHEGDRQQLPVTNHIPYASRLLKAILHCKAFAAATVASFIALLLHIVWEASQTEPSRSAIQVLHRNRLTEIRT